MALLEWSDALALDLPEMDDTHHAFVDLLAAVESAPDAALLPAWQALIEHTDAHFGQEDAWMAATRFAASNCHTTQHKVVLGVMREGAVMGAQGNLAAVRQMARELADWFPPHAQAMDAALALHLRRVGFDPASGTIHQPHALPADLLHGCGGSSCHTPDNTAEAVPA